MNIKKHENLDDGNPENDDEYKSYGVEECYDVDDVAGNGGWEWWLGVIILRMEARL